MACQHRVPIIVIVVNNGYLSLIRQNQRYTYEYEYAVNLAYANEGNAQVGGIDNVRLAQAFGCYAERVTKPGDIRPAFERAVASGRPAVIDIIVERQTDAAMGASLDAVREFD